jgi:hypothetical protein
MRHTAHIWKVEMNYIFWLNSLNRRHTGVNGRIIHTYFVHAFLSQYNVVLKT